MHRGVLATNKCSLCNPRLIRRWNAICLWKNLQKLNPSSAWNLWLLFLSSKIATKSQVLFFLRLLCSLLWTQERNLNKAWVLQGSGSVGHCKHPGHHLKVVHRKATITVVKKISWRWVRRNECSSLSSLLHQTTLLAVLSCEVVVAQLFLGKICFLFLLFFIIANYYYSFFRINR